MRKFGFGIAVLGVCSFSGLQAEGCAPAVDQVVSIYEVDGSFLFKFLNSPTPGCVLEIPQNAELPLSYIFTERFLNFVDPDGAMHLKSAKIKMLKGLYITGCDEETYLYSQDLQTWLPLEGLADQDEGIFAFTCDQEGAQEDVIATQEEGAPQLVEIAIQDVVVMTEVEGDKDEEVVIQPVESSLEDVVAVTEVEGDDKEVVIQPVESSVEDVIAMTEVEGDKDGEVVIQPIEASVEDVIAMAEVEGDDKEVVIRPVQGLRFTNEEEVVKEESLAVIQSEEVAQEDLPVISS